MKFRLGFFAPLLAALVAQGAGAHHGWSGYTDDFEMEFTVVELRFINPHDQMLLLDAEGVVWDFLLAPPIRNRQYGYNESSVSVGDTVKVIGRRSTSIKEGKAYFIYNTGGEAIYTYRYADGTPAWDRR